MIQSVESKKADYTYEFMQLVNAVIKFRDYYYAKKGDYGIPQAKLTELDGYIAEIFEPKFGDLVKSKQTNSLVEAIRVIGELVPYVEVDLYSRGYYMSPTLKSYNITYYSGFKNNWWNYPPYSLFDAYVWRHRSTNPLSMSCFEHWFNVSKHYGNAKLHLKYQIFQGKVGQAHIKIHFLTSGSPLPKPSKPSDGMLSIEDRGDVVKKATVEFDYQSGKSSYDVTKFQNVDATIPYIVVACQDKWSDSLVHIEILKVSISP